MILIPYSQEYWLLVVVEVLILVIMEAMLDFLVKDGAQVVVAPLLQLLFFKGMGAYLKRDCL